MTLADYLRANGLTYMEFGRRIGTTHEAVRRYAIKGRVPEPPILRTIMRVTEGAVRPDDFFPDPPAPPTQGEAA